jgi:(E)-4-hydroxy-3-methylbut-2-enyl-diphosphate synthase
MVASALEFVRICRHYDYHDIVLSMKASNPLVMMQAYRLLVARMNELGMDYPLHLGVTEAGDGEEGRVKSAIGIGSLLADGIGDTIRVSLTEDSVHEIPAAMALVKPYNDRRTTPKDVQSLPIRLRTSTLSTPIENRHPYTYKRRNSTEISIGKVGVGGAQPVRVELATTVPLADIDSTINQIRDLITPAQANAPVSEVVRLHATSAADLEAFAQIGKRMQNDGLNAPLALYLPASLYLESPRLLEGEGQAEGEIRLTAGVAKIITAPDPNLSESAWHEQVQQIIAAAQKDDAVIEWMLSLDTIPQFLRAVHGATLEGIAQTACRLGQRSQTTYPHASVFSLDTKQPIYAYRFLAAQLDQEGLAAPLHLKSPVLKGRQETLFQSSVGLGALLSDGLGDSLQIDSDLSPRDAIRLSYNILQAARLRMSKTEFISCPSCGRTLFDLQTATERIKSRMSHLKDVKIAIMGCIVNGPGEMADADFGYVGAGPGKISLYVGKECVERNIPATEADERLVELIKAHDKWVEPV